MFDFWEVMLDPVFLIMFGLSAIGFLPLLYSVWRTWEDNKGLEKPPAKSPRTGR